MSIFKLIVIILFSPLYIYCDDQEDGSPHFQIDHKSGKLDIMATRTSADIQSKEDYVDLVMKPGESLTPSFSHGLHHEDDSHHQRHDMPHEEQGVSKPDASVSEDAKQKSDQEGLNNFDGKWMNLFKFPKVNRTVAVNVNRNVTSKKTTNETAMQIEEREVAKMVELQNKADSLAKLVEESSKKRISPDEVKTAAADLERRAEELQEDVVENFVNHGEFEGKKKGIETPAEINSRDKDNDNKAGESSKTRADKVGKGNEKMNWKGKQGEKSKENCPNCGGKIPKPGERINGPIAPKLSKGDNKTMAKSDANRTKSDNTLIGKKDSNDSKIGESHTVKGEESKYFQDDGKPNDENDTLEKNFKGQAKANKNQKSREECKDCQTKVPKAGDKDDGKLIVPKLNGANETEVKSNFIGSEEDRKKDDKDADKTDGKGEKSKAKDFKGDGKTEKSGKDCKNCQGRIPKPGDKDDGKLIVPKLNGANETEDQSNFIGSEEDKKKDDKDADKTDGKGEKSKAKDFNGDGKTAKSGKDCKNCQGRITKPGDKDDGKLIVPKLTKENDTKKIMRHSKFKIINIQVPTPDRNESFDLDNDAQDITEDGSYMDLFSSMTQPKRGNETVDKFQLDANSSLKRLGLQNKTTSKESNERNGLSREMDRASDAAIGATEEKKKSEDEEKSVKFNNNEGTSGDITQNKDAEDSSNVDDGSKNDASLLADKAKIQSERKEAESDVTKEKKLNDTNVGDNNFGDSNKVKIDKTTSENARKSKGKSVEKNVSRMEASVEKNSDKQDATLMKLKETFDAAHATEKVDTVKQFDKLLSKFLSSSSPEKRKELLKLTWHDLRQRHSKGEGDNKRWKEKSSEEKGEENIHVTMSEPKNESDTTGRAQDVQSSTKSTNADDFESIIGRIREKVALLKNLVQYTKMKKLKKVHDKVDPYAGFKREGIS